MILPMCMCASVVCADDNHRCEYFDAVQNHTPQKVTDAG